MFFREYPSVCEATEALFLNRNGRLFAEASNLLMQEVRDVTTYVAILRSIGSGDKESGKIAEKCGMDPRNVFTYLGKLIDLEIVAAVKNPLDSKKANHRYRIADPFFRFNYSFIEPHISMITAVGPRAGSYILNQYKEFCGIVYEDIIRSECFEYAINGKFPFMPGTVGKWWGNIRSDGSWTESEIDVVAYDEKNIILGECKYRSKAIGIKELDSLKIKASFVPVKGRTVYYLLASKSGFTSELNMLHDDSIILINKA